MIRRFLPRLVLIGAISTALLTPSASLAAQNPATADCNANGRLTHQYSPAQLRTALATMPADIKEYTDCYDVIVRALDAQLGKTGGQPAHDPGSGGSFLPTWLIVILVLLGLAAATFGAVAIRRRREHGGP
jgi:hypothetical protein